MLHHVDDNLGVVEALGAQTAVIVGHDWGSPIAANSALLRPDVFGAVALLSVPYTPPGGGRPTAAFAAMGGSEEFYINYFQEPGRAEAEAELDVRAWLLGFYVGASGDAVAPPDGGTMATVPQGGMLRDRFCSPNRCPAGCPRRTSSSTWRSSSGPARAPSNRYRNVDRDWVDLQPWRGRPITVPSLFIGGEKDGPTIWAAGRSRFRGDPAGLRGVRPARGAGTGCSRSGPPTSTTCCWHGRGVL